MIGTVILAAGKGYRFGEMKQFKEVDGVSPLSVVYEKFKSYSTRVVVVVPEEKTLQYAEPDAKVVSGGEYRLESIRAGVEPMMEDEAIDRIIIAEASRPFVEKKLVKEMIAVLGDVVIVFSPCPYVMMHDASEYRGYYYGSEVFVHKPRERIRIIEPPSIWKKEMLIKLLRELKPRMCSSQVPSVYAPLITRNIGWVNAHCCNPKITFKYDFAMFEKYVREIKNGGI